MDKRRLRARRPRALPPAWVLSMQFSFVFHFISNSGGFISEHHNPENLMFRPLRKRRKIGILMSERPSSWNRARTVFQSRRAMIDPVVENNPGRLYDKIWV
jgi:ligand-binding sensor domain-containing protein